MVTRSSQVLAEERYYKITTILREQGFATVDDLARSINVSGMTIRRDLEQCRKNGTIRRCRGGAALADINQELSFDTKSEENREVKRIIAGRVAKLVEAGMAVFIDAGTTGFEIAQSIRDIPRLTIVSNDVHTIGSLLGSKAELICIGGIIQKSTGSTFDHFAEQLLNQLHFDIAFLGAQVINSDFFVMTPTAEKVFFKQKILDRSSETYLAVDHSKFGKSALYTINNLVAYTGVITDYVFSEEESSAIIERGIRVVPVLRKDT
jgi:DeoR/GlpR family transcriptional regulator of sugar metabolism